MNTTQPATPAEKIIIKDMLNELVNNALVVVLLPAPEQRHTGHMVRAVEQQNANWYREFCADHEEYRAGYEKPKTIIKRQDTINALYRVLDGDCVTVYAQRLLEHVRAALPHPMAQPAIQPQEKVTMNYHDKKTSTATLDTKQAKKFRTLADNMIKTIDDKLNPATGDLNPTPRRVRIAQGMREDGYAL